MDADWNLRFGLEALDRGLIDSDRLIQAGLAWRRSPGRTLADVVTERGWISPDDRAAIEGSLATRPDGNGNGNGDGNGDGPPHDSLADPSTAAPGRDDGITVAHGGHAPAPPGSTTRRDPRGWRRGGKHAHGPIPFGPRYANVAFHAEGGIGRVFLAFDTVLKREVALKEIKPDLAGEARVERRFLEEARITARLQHPNIVATHDLVENPTGRSPFYSMRFLDGPTLKEAVTAYHRPKPGTPPDPAAFRRLLDAFLGACNAIAFSHSQGVIHRDLKGQNIILGPFGEAFVLDWGLAKEVDAPDDPLARPIEELADLPPEMTRTMEGYPIGTLHYMPPEQAEGKRDAIGPHSDVFGLGAILYLILTGRPPYEGGDSTEILRRALARDLRRPSQIDPKVPPALESICLKAMAKTPSDRYESAELLADDVRRWMADEPVEAHAEGIPARAGRWARKHQPIVAGVVALLLTASVGLGVGAWRVGVESSKVEAEAFKVREQRDRASAMFEESLQVVDGVLAVVVHELPHVRDPRVDAARLKAAETVGRFAQTLVGRDLASMKARIALAAALRESAKVYELAFRFDESEALLRRAIEACSEGKDDELLVPGTAPAAMVAALRTSLALVFLQRGQPKAADAEASRVEAWAERTRARDPGSSDVARTAALARLCRGDAAEARGAFADSARYREEASTTLATLRDGPHPGPSDALMAVIARSSAGTALRESGQLDRAKATLAAALADARALADRTGDDDARHAAAISAVELARTLNQSGDRDGAVRMLDDTLIANLSDLAAARPSVLGFSHDAACARIIRGEIGRRTDDLARAETDLAAIVARVPAALQCRAWRARALVGLAEADAKAGRLVDARTRHGTASSEVAAVVAVNSKDPVAHGVRARLDAVSKLLDAPITSPMK